MAQESGYSSFLLLKFIAKYIFWRSCMSEFVYNMWDIKNHFTKVQVVSVYDYKLCSCFNRTNPNFCFCLF